MVSADRSKSEERTRTDSRGQLLLITAVLIAVFVLSAVVLLNLLHESPEMGTEQDSKSMEASERIVGQLEKELDRYFMALSHDDPVPFAHEADLDELDGKFGERYTNISSVRSSGVLDIRYQSGTEGNIIWVNDSTETDIEQETRLVEDADGLVRLYLDGADDLRLNISGKPMEIADGAVSWDGTEVCSPEQNFELDLRYGSGEIRSESTYCTMDIRSDLDEEFDINVTSGDISHSSTVVLSTAGGNADGDEIRDGGFNAETEVIVEPTFDIEYHDPYVEFEATVELYGGGS